MHTQPITPPPHTSPHSPLNLDDVYAACHKRVYTICLRMARNADDADDLAQEVWARVTKIYRQFRGESDVMTWLWRIAYTVSFDWMLRGETARVRKMRSLEELASAHDVERDELASLMVRDKALEGVVLRVTLEPLIERLPDRHRCVVRGYYYEGETICDLARALGASVSTVKSWLWEARWGLAVALGRDVCDKRERNVRERGGRRRGQHVGGGGRRKFALKKGVLGRGGRGGGKIETDVLRGGDV